MICIDLVIRTRFMVLIYIFINNFFEVRGQRRQIRHSHHRVAAGACFELLTEAAVNFLVDQVDFVKKGITLTKILNW